MEGQSIEKLMQAQCEIEASLRTKVEDAADVEAVAGAVGNIHLFMQDVHNAARELDIGVEDIVQALLTKVGTATDFDKQAGNGMVPMHQNKVLDRSNRVLRMDCDIVKDSKWVLKQVKENLPQLLSSLETLRALVRIKVEDACDIEMARKWAELAVQFFSVLKNISIATSTSLSHVWTALATNTLNIETLDNMMNSCTEMEQDVELGDLTLLSTLRTPFGARLEVLNSIQSDDLESRETLMADAVLAQLKDSRSQVLKAACAAVKRLSVSPVWPSIAGNIVSGLVQRLNVSNKGLCSEVYSALMVCVASCVEAVSVVSGWVKKSPQLAIQTKCAEALCEYVETSKITFDFVSEAGHAAVSSRYQPARAAGKRLLDTIRSLTPPLPSTPLSPEESSPLTLLKLRLQRRSVKQSQSPMASAPPTLHEVPVNVGFYPLEVQG
eukprot:TRINITY_DN4853_c3_g1_i1.p1 TRINITY_DN4853_c3_g1~~TRINITY_DN4853_c3_g1_i1.p1  ORF type:complete len:459 (+),score=98.89 TRINITY_DN4853_c3_g1_i1:63-1379(+)